MMTCLNNTDHVWNPPVKSTITEIKIDGVYVIPVILDEGYIDAGDKPNSCRACAGSNFC